MILGRRLRKENYDGDALPKSEIPRPGLAEFGHMRHVVKRGCKWPRGDPVAIGLLRGDPTG